jgi:hypothetical protein
MPKFVRQGDNTLIGNNTFTGTNTFSGAIVATGGVTGGLTRLVAAQATGTKAVSAAESGTMFVNTQGASTTTFTLPAAAAGLEYTFVEANASGEILITPAAGDAIVGKIHAAQDGTALAPAAGTGIKNTAATNVAGDAITLVALDATTWYAVAQTGLWASQ